MSTTPGSPESTVPSRGGRSPAASGEPAAVASATPSVSERYWLVPVLRAIPALIVGLVVTFNPDHSAHVGLLSFGAFALASGLIVLIGSMRTLADRVVRSVFIAHGAISVASGVAALVFWNGGVSVLLLIITVFAALTGVLELYASMRARGSAPARDWFAVGAYTAVAAIVFVLLPSDSVVATGLIGAYGMILGVFLIIAGLSLRWAKPVVDAAEGEVTAETIEGDVPA